MLRTLAGAVVLVLDADGEVGRAVALAVGGRGASVVAVGEREPALAHVVGEIACAGGKARHVVGGVAEGTAKAKATWGRVDFVVAGDHEAARRDSPDAVAEAIAGALVRALAQRGEEAERPHESLDPGGRSPT